VEDDPNVTEVVARYLEREGFVVTTVSDGQEALVRALSEPADLVVLDLMLPGLSGLDVCRRLRAVSPVPIIMLTARTEEADRVIGLDLGGDDYITKPFSPRELTSRVKAVLRRSQRPGEAEGQAPRRLLADGLELDILAREVQLDGAPIALTAKEFDLLAFLMRHPRCVYGRDRLLEEVWGYAYGDTSTVTVHVRRLREKIEVDPSHPRRISTVWGVGYGFEGTPSS
jgi:DNA-binding response OmpR family regulator